MNKHYYTVKMSVADVRDSGEFDGYASVFNEEIPSYREIVDPGAYKKTISDNGGKVPVLYMHDAYGRPPIGLGQRAVEDQRGLNVSAKLSIDTHQIANETWGFMKLVHEADRKIGLSVGFLPVQTDEIDGWYHVKEAKLFEYSITPPDWQAGPSAGVSDMRSAYQRSQAQFIIQLLTELGVAIPNATRLDDYLVDNGDGRETTIADDDPEAPEPVDTTQAATDEDESQELHSLMIDLHSTFTKTVDKLKTK